MASNVLRDVGVGVHLLFSTDALLRVTYVSAAIRHVLGYEPDEIVGRVARDYVHPDDTEAAIAMWERLASGESLRRVELRLRRRDGCYVPFILDALPRLDEGQFVGIDGVGCAPRPAGFTRDVALGQIASLRRASRPLAAAGGLPSILSALSGYPIDLGADSCWIGLLEEGALDVRPVAHAGPDGAALAAAEAGRILGRGPIERAIITRATVVETLDDDASTPLLAEARRRGHRALAVVPVVHADQPLGVVCVYSRRQQFLDARRLRLLELFAQVAAAAVVSTKSLGRERHAEARLRDLVEQLPCIVYVSRAAWPPQLLFMSGNIERFVGYPPEDFYADGSLSLRCIHPDDRQRFAEHTRRHTTLDEPHTIEYRLLHRNGRDVTHVAGHSIPVHDDAGRLVLRQGIIVDITERRRLEEELLQSQRLAAIGEMAAMLAHEIRNPLAGMSLALRVLRGANGDEETAGECLEDLAQCLGRINATVSRILDFSKARPLVARRCTLPPILDAARRLTATYVRKNGITLDLDVEPDLPELVADPDQLEQVFVNLILNACKAMPDGGRVALAVSARDQHLCVEVADTGIGISPEQLDHIFDPFYSAFGHGTGLGLTLCRRIVQAHGGRIDARSRPGKGSTFRIELPPEPPHAPNPGD